MKSHLFICALALCSAQAQAHTINYSFGSFDEANTAPNFIEFKMASTKLGLFTSHFNGFARKFSINYELEGQNVKTARITLPIEHFDTDDDGRNQTVRGDCLNVKKFPEVTVLIADPIPLDGQERTVPAIMNLRGYDKPITIRIRAVREGRKIVAEINGQFSMRELDIPDPSMVVAKLRDQIDLKARLEASE